MRLTRITLAIIALIIAAGFNLLVNRQLADVEPQLFQVTEEVMVDTANILAAFAEKEFRSAGFDSESFQRGDGRRAPENPPRDDTQAPEG